MAFLSVIIPVYKCADCINELYGRLMPVLQKITDDFEIIMVNDASPQNDWAVIKELAKKDRRVKGVNLSRNFGQHYAITAGLDYSTGEWVVVMDGDLQDRPEEIEKLYNKALEGYDIVLAGRFRRKDNFIKKFTSQVFYKIFSYMADMNYDGTVGNFRICRRPVIDSFLKMRENLRFFGGLMSWLGFKYCVIDVEHAKNISRKTSYSFSRLFRLAFHTVIAYSNKPLRFSINTGIFISVLAFMYAIYRVIVYFKYKVPVPGWTSLIVSLWFLFGILFINLGIVGIYVGKIFEEVKKRPLYVVEESVNLIAPRGGD